ncbi:MAG: RagB/SusD family nutrient uptake outer membrane protein [Bacteroidota bacterium]
MLLAKLYLNAEVYAGKDANTQCITYCQKVIDAGYQLDENYEHLFLADNNTTTGLIFPVAFDGLSTRTWGGMTFVVHAAVGGSMPAADFGLDGGWGGTRTTSALVEKFPSTGGSLVVAPNPGAAHPVIYVPGSYQGWDPANESTVLGSVNDDDKYEGYFNFTEPDTKFKITTGPNWDVNFGDSDGDGKLDPGGDDIVASEAGFYRVTVDLNDSTYTAEKTIWGIIGSATDGGWDSDTDMTYDDVEGAWTLTTGLVQGEIKFRANDDWGINYGDSGADAILDFDGSNIIIEEGSTYIIKLYLDKPDHTYSIEKASFDGRAMFYTDGQSLEINDVSQFTEGYAITKYKNIDRSGAVGSDLTFPDTDFPMFRLADAYLMYAEAVVRGGTGGDRATAVQYVNAVKERAFGDSGGNITDADLTLEFLLDERARELYWECHRRTDLIRFGQFSDGDYLWPLKGGVPEGRAVNAIRDVFPIPSSDIGANPNLDQNDGY